MTDTAEELTPPATADDLTGAYVRHMRERYKLGRQQFQDLCGYTGKSAARIANIETKDSWKPGDKERVFAFIQHLEAEPERVVEGTPRRGRRSASARGDAAQNDASRVDGRPAVDDVADVDDTSTGDVVIPFDDQDALDLLTFATPEPNGGAEEHYAEQAPVASGSTIEVEWLTDPVPSTVAGVDSQTLTPVLDPATTVVDLPMPEVVRLPPVPPGGFRVSNGMIQTFKRCPRKFWLAWMRQLALKRDDPTSVRSTGTRVHKALAAFYAPPGTQSIDPRDALERVIVDDWTAIRDDVYAASTDANEAELRLSELANEFNSAAALERAMIEGYVEWLVETGADSDLEVLTAETPQAAQLEVDGVPIQVVSLTDTRVRRKTDDVLLFVDHKTVGNLTSPTRMLHMNPQMLHYHLVEWLNTDEGERRCDGALYNMLRRVKRTGAAKPPFFDRVEVRHSDVELDSYRRQLTGTVRRILQTRSLLAAGADHQEVVPPVEQEDCQWSCDFFPICHMFDDGSHVEDMIAGLYRQVNPWERYDGLHLDANGANDGLT